MNRQVFVMGALVLGLLLSPCICIAAQATRDREIVIDVSRLSQAIQEAMEPIAERMRSSGLKQCFSEVKAILKEEDVVKEELVEALRRLNDHLSEFTRDWEQITSPLWKGQDALGETISKVQKMLAKNMGGELSEKMKARLRTFDSRLSDLARQIQSEQDPVRKKRLKMVFANILSLRKLTESCGNIDLGPATEALQIRIVKALSCLQDQLTMATFEVEKCRAILISQTEFVSNYADIVQGMIEAEQLAKWVADMNKAGAGLGDVTTNLIELKNESEDFANMMADFAGELVKSLESETAKIAAQASTPKELKNIDVDAEVRKFASMKNR